MRHESSESQRSERSLICSSSTSLHHQRNNAILYLDACVVCPISLLTITSAGAHLPSRGCMRHSSTSSSPSTNLSQSSWPDVEPHAYPLWSAVQRRSASVQTREALPIDLWQTIPCRHNPPASWDDHEQIVSTQKCVGICTLYMSVAVVHHRQRIMPPETHPVHFLVRSAPSAPRQGTREG